MTADAEFALGGRVFLEGVAVLPASHVQRITETTRHFLATEPTEQVILWCNGVDKDLSERPDDLLLRQSCAVAREIVVAWVDEKWPHLPNRGRRW